MIRYFFALVLCLQFIPAYAVGNDPYDWLARMAKSTHQLSYEGIFVYSHDGLMESMRIIHRSSDQGESERMITLNGKQREVLRNQDNVTCIIPDAESILVDRSHAQRSMLSALTRPDTDLSSTYQLTLQGKDRVAEMDVRIINIQPVDRYRYGYRLWLHEKTALPLRTMLIGADGEVLEQVIFTSFELRGAISDQELAPTLEGRHLSWVKAESRDDSAVDEKPIWIVSKKPKGFTLRSVRVQQIPGRPMPAMHHLYSDGIASVSVYIETVIAGNNHQGATRKGAISAFGHVNGNYQITAIGEVPPETVMLFAQSLRLSEAN